jgi:hypothetical protein
MAEEHNRNQKEIAMSLPNAVELCKVAFLSWDPNKAHKIAWKLIRPLRRG